MLSRILKRYYEPLRIPPQPSTISASPYTYSLMVCATTMTGLPPCTIYLPLHATPATPMESTKRFRYPVSLTMAFPKRPPGRLPHLKLTRLLIGSLTLRPAILPLENLQPLITQPLLPGTTKVYGQLLRRDFNPLDRSPKTAYGQYTYFAFALALEQERIKYTVPGIPPVCSQNEFPDMIDHPHDTSLTSRRTIK
jgi:hypothetical protein